MAKKLVKKQSGGGLDMDRAKWSAGQKAEARRDSLYKANKAKTDSMYKAMMNDSPKVSAPRGKDTVRVGSVRITAASNVAKKKSGGSINSKKKK